MRGMLAGWSEADGLWIRLVWFTRLRWVLPPLLGAIARGMEWWAGRPLFPRGPLLALFSAILGANAVYALLLHRWRADREAHLGGLRTLAHAQLAIDLLVDATALHFTGGLTSPFWPFLVLQVLVAALVFPSTRVVAGYAAGVLVLALVVARTQGLPHSLNLLSLAALLALVLVLDAWFIRELRLVEDATVELARLRVEKSAAEEISHKKDRVLSLVSHELGNPLAALRSFVHVARERDAAGNQAIEQMLARMGKQVERMVRVVGDLYDLASVQSGQLRIDRRTCDLTQVVGELADRFRALHPALALTVEAPAALWGSWDPQRIDQLLTNLLSNAIKYAGEKGPVAIVLAAGAGATAELSVRDHGPGIAASELPLIFEPFRRAESRDARGGLGLGLALARQIAILHDGAIWVESAPGGGALFHVRLPTGGMASPS